MAEKQFDFENFGRSNTLLWRRVGAYFQKSLLQIHKIKIKIILDYRYIDRIVIHTYKCNHIVCLSIIMKSVCKNFEIF